MLRRLMAKVFLHKEYERRAKQKIENQTLGKCPYCNSADIELVMGAKDNPKALFRCKNKQCGKTFFRHQLGIIELKKKER